SFRLQGFLPAHAGASAVLFRTEFIEIPVLLNECLLESERAELHVIVADHRLFKAIALADVLASTDHFEEASRAIDHSKIPFPAGSVGRVVCRRDAAAQDHC